ncbi:MAG: hypothetical protein FLDDKLPJ_00926 [Phycisphaerae bacterium]|nr:hypothetical protein [Phycisphaerae bacterium]
MTSCSRKTWLPVLVLVSELFSVPQLCASDSGAWTLVDPWLRPRGELAMAYDSGRGVTVMFGGFHEYGDVYLGDTWEYDGQRWTRMSTEGPNPRSACGMAYDSVRGVTVLYGGKDAEGQYGDTWEWDGETWSLRTTEGPGARRLSALAYDEHRGVVVLYGGYGESRKHDTWEWDGLNWSLRTTQSQPELNTPRMVYDNRRRVMVLLGTSQTWEFDGTDWIQREDGPVQSGAGLAYDSARGVTVRYGDYWGNDDTWEWDGVSWVLASQVGVRDVYAQGMAYDSRRGVTVLFGGYSSVFARDTTWEWNGESWTMRSNAPLGRVYSQMVYHAARGHSVLLGGSRHPSSDDDEYTFAWDGRQWSLLSIPGPGAYSSHAMIYDTRRDLTLLYGGTKTWAWDGAAWWLLADTGPSQRFRHAMAYDRARDRVVLFGGDARGDDGEFYFNGETWEWDGAVWTLESTRGPSDRAYHAMAYDSARAVTILFGGNTKRTARRFNGETWEWDGRRWTLVADTGPAPRIEHKIVYDEDRKVAILYGGQGVDGQNFSDLWEWDGVEWRERQVEFPQPSRHSHAMAYDSDRKRMVIFGGWGEHSERLGDTWEFDPCVGLTKLKARCKAGGGGEGEAHLIKVTVKTTLPEGSTVPVDNTDVSNNTTDRQRIPVNSRGKAKHKWSDQHGEHTITLADCPRMTQTVTCSP